MEGWRSIKLASVLTVQNGYAFDSKAFGPSGTPLIRIRDLKSGTSTETNYSGEFDARYLVNAGDLLVGMDGEFACYEWKGEPALLNQRVCRLQGFSDALNPRFLFYGINKHLKAIEDVTGFTTVKHLSSKQILGIEFLVPPKDEQRRIVAILDEAFEAISTAKANTEKNLQNAREVASTFVAALISRKHVGWKEAPISNCFKVRSGDFLPTKKMATDGAIPVYGGNGIAGTHNASNLSGDHVVIGRVGAKCGNVRHVAGDFWLTDNAFYVSEYLHPFDPAFLTLLLDTKNLRSTANQAAQPVISYTTIKDVPLCFPASLDEQRELAARAATLEADVENLLGISTAKLAALDELKKSLLHQAFTGQLTTKATDQQLEAVA